MDSLLYWNAVALEANRRDFGRAAPEQGGPTLSSRALAIIHLAIYDAWQSAQSVPDYYLPGGVSAPAGAAVDDLIAGAAHAALTALYPSQTSHFDDARALVTDVVSLGYQHGVGFATRLLADRAGDPGASGSYTPSSAVGGHRVDPAHPAQGFHGATYGTARLFAATTRFTIPAPYSFTNNAALYQAAVAQVRAKGIAPHLMGTLTTGTKRTNDETLIGIFWGYDGVPNLGTPPRLYNQIVRRVAIARGNTLDQNVRLFAAVNTAMGDAGILAWAEKYRYNFWRPVVGIREHDRSMAAADTAAQDPDDDLNNLTDTSWLPLGAPRTNIVPASQTFTPNFPAYPSGHATFGAAAFESARQFYGVSSDAADTLTDGLSFVSDEYNGHNVGDDGALRPRHERTFDGGFWKMIEENGASRVFLGVHWEFDAFTKVGGNIDVNGLGGVPLGLKIARSIATGGLHRSAL